MCPDICLQQAQEAACLQNICVLIYVYYRLYMCPDICLLQAQEAARLQKEVEAAKKEAERERASAQVSVFVPLY